MTCTDWRERLLEADPDELRGQQSTELAAHITACRECRALADRVLAEEERLRTALASLGPHRPLDDALASALQRARRQRHRRWVLGAIPVAAAAGLAALLFALPGSRPAPIDAPTTVTRNPAFVESAPGQNVVIYQTANPDIVVVWLYRTNGS